MKKLIRNHYNKQSGFSTMEILVSVAILVMSFGGVITLVMGSQKLSVDTEANQIALRGAEKHLEEARAALRNNFSTNFLSTTTESIDGLNYQVTKTTTTQDYCAKEVTVAYDWTIEGRAQHIELTERITDPVVAFAAGSGCDPSGPPGGGEAPWESCHSATSVDFNPSGIQGTDIDVFNIGTTRYAFVTSSKNPATNPDLWLYDISDISGLSDDDIVVNKDIGTRALLAVQVVYYESLNKYYAFTITDENTNQIRVFDVSELISNPGLPQDTRQVASLDIPIGTSAKTLAYYSGVLYVGLGTQLAVVNVTNPLSLTSYSLVQVNHTINKVMISGGYAFLATSDNAGELKAVNLSNTSQIHSFDANEPSSGNNNADGMSVFVSGGIAYLGRDSAGSGPDFWVIDVSNPAIMTKLDHDDLGSNNGSLVDLVVHSGFAFIATNHPTGGFDVWNVRDPRNIYENCINDPNSNNDNGVNVANLPAGLDFLDNIVFATSPSNDALRVLTDPNNE